MAFDRLYIVCDICKRFTMVSKIYSDYQLELDRDYSLDRFNGFFERHYNCAMDAGKFKEITFSFGNEERVYGGGYTEEVLEESNATSK